MKQLSMNKGETSLDDKATTTAEEHTMMQMRSAGGFNKGVTRSSMRPTSSYVVASSMGGMGDYGQA